MKVMLLVPRGGYYAERWTRGVLMPPLGLAYLGAALKERGVEVEFVDAHAAGLGRRALAAKLRASRPDVVGVTFTTENRFHGFRTIRLARKALPSCPIVAGGPHVSLAADDTLRHVPELDAVVRGEGERTFAELAEAFGSGRGPEGIPGVSFRDADDVRHNEDRPFVGDLDEIALPDRGLFDADAYHFLLEIPGGGARRAAGVLSSRGCPHGCLFCSSCVMWGARARMRSPESVVDEIAHLVTDRGTDAVWFLDDTFSLDRDRVERICDLIVERELDVKWFCEARVEDIDWELLRRMAGAGCCRIGFGVESGSQRILDTVLRKKADPDRVRKIPRWCRELGIVAHPFFILSHPGETHEDARATFDLIRLFVPDHEPSLSLLHIYPGTALEALAKERRILAEDFCWSAPPPAGGTYLPSAVQGDVPLFKDTLSWKDIGFFLREWAALSGRRYSVLKSLPAVIAGARSWGGVKRCAGFIAGAGPWMLPFSVSRPFKVAVRLSRVYWDYVVARRARLGYLPMRLWLEPSGECNLKCVMCPQSAPEEIARGLMKPELFRRIVDECAGFADDVSLHHRGESLLHPELCAMIEYAGAKGLYTKLHTNGSLLDEDTGRRILASSLDCLSFSFDGVDPAGYERVRSGARFDDVEGRIVRFLRARQHAGRGRPYTVVEVLDMPETGLTVEGTREFVERFVDMGVDEVEIKTPHNWAGSFDIGEPREGGHTSHCLFPWFSLTVFWDGTVVACPQDFYGAQVLGNAKESTLAEIWNGDRMIALREKMLAREYDELDPCRKCDMLTRETFLGVPKSSFTAVRNILKFW